MTGQAAALFEQNLACGRKFLVAIGICTIINGNLIKLAVGIGWSARNANE